MCGGVGQEGYDVMHAFKRMIDFVAITKVYGNMTLKILIYQTRKRVMSCNTMSNELVSPNKCSQLKLQGRMPG